MLERNELPTLQTFEESLYDISINSIDGEKDILSKYKGKVTMITNVTGECANSAQYPIIESLYNGYKDQGFEVLAIPSTDFCEFAYGEFADTSATAENMRAHMQNHYKTDLPYAEMVTIKKDEETGSAPHKLYDILQYGGFPANGGPVQGNFEKFIISRDGKKMYRFCNSDLLDLAFDAGNRKTDSNQAFINIKAAIEVMLEGLV
jgi:glutathione peroxidase